MPWHKESAFRLPVETWREMMDSHFPGSAWVRIRRDTMDELLRFRTERVLPSWDDTFLTLLSEKAPQ